MEHMRLIYQAQLVLYIKSENGHLYVNNELKYGDESDSLK